MVGKGLNQMGGFAVFRGITQSLRKKCALHSMLVVFYVLTSYLYVAPGMCIKGHAERHGVVDPRVGVDDQQPPHLLRRRHHSTSESGVQIYARLEI